MRPHSSRTAEQSFLPCAGYVPARFGLWLKSDPAQDAGTRFDAHRRVIALEDGSCPCVHGEEIAKMSPVDGQSIEASSRPMT